MIALASVKPAKQVYEVNLLNARLILVKILYFIKLVSLSNVHSYKNGPVNLYFLAVIRRGFLRLDDEWISPLNGFQYKLIATGGGWQYSRDACQTMGGDLATHGIQDWETRR